MNEVQKALFSKARRAIEAARLILDHEDAEGATNRAYYAMFYAAKAALLSKGEHTKSHHGTHQQFHLHFVKSGPLAHKVGTLLSFAHDYRLRADYHAFSHLDVRATSDLVNDAEHFVNAVEEMMLGEAEAS